MDKHLSYWQDHLELEQFESWHDNGAQKALMNTIALRAKEKNYKSILDAGAGTGELYNVLNKQNLNLEYQGLEITEKFVDRATSKGIPMRLGDIEQLTYENNSYDFCIAAGVMNHLLDPRPMVLELFRVAKEEVFISFFKPFIEKLFFQKDTGGHVFGAYRGKVDTGNLPTEYPYIGFYPCRTHHCPVSVLNQNYELHKSTFGFYLHYAEDNAGQPICIHHYYQMTWLCNYIVSLGIDPEDITFGFHEETHLDYEHLMREIGAFTVPHKCYFADMMFIKMPDPKDKNIPPVSDDLLIDRKFNAKESKLMTAAPNPEGETVRLVPLNRTELKTDG